MTENQAHADPPPADYFACVGINFPNLVPKGFFRNIRVIDEEVLRKTNVGPKDCESQAEAGEIVAVGLVVDALQSPPG